MKSIWSSMAAVIMYNSSKKTNTCYIPWKMRQQNIRWAWLTIPKSSNLVCSCIKSFRKKGARGALRISKSGVAASRIRQAHPFANRGSSFYKPRGAFVYRGANRAHHFTHTSRPLNEFGDPIKGTSNHRHKVSILILCAELTENLLQFFTARRRSCEYKP